MVQLEKQLAILGRRFIAREVASNFSIFRLIKNPEIEMRIDWINRLNQTEKNAFLEDLFLPGEPSPLVKQFNSLRVWPSGGCHLFETRKKLLSRLKKNQEKWAFRTIDNETVSAFYHIGQIKLRVAVCATSKDNNINVWHTIYRETDGIFGFFVLTGFSHFYHQDAWHAENLDADQEIDSVIKILDSGFDILTEAIGNCSNAFDEIDLSEQQ